MAEGFFYPPLRGLKGMMPAASTAAPKWGKKMTKKTAPTKPAPGKGKKGC